MQQAALRMHGQRSECADLPEGFNTFIDKRKPDMKERKRRKKGKCSYTALLVMSLTIAALIGGYDSIRSGEMNRWLSDMTTKAQAVSASLGQVWDWDDAGAEEDGAVHMAAKAADSAAEGTADAGQADATGSLGEGGNSSSGGEENALPEETSLSETEEEIGQQPEMYTADRTYFDDALFIGDSRTVGLQEYGDLGNAEVVADLGMSVYKVFSKKFSTTSGEKKRLETVLSERQFGKIYLMMGINELGYDFDHTVLKYAQMIDRIRELQPQALIFLEANLHITEKKSAASPIYNNENIDRFNESLARMADGETIFYLDANELFDDETGNLSEACTTDDTHILARYYPDWTTWILQHARKEK